MKGIEKINFLIDSSKKNQRPLPHMLVLTEDYSIVKQIGKFISQKTGMNLAELDLDSWENNGDMAAVLTNLQKGDILLVPDANLMGKEFFRYFIDALENFTVDLLIDSGASSRIVQLSLNQFTVVASAPSVTSLSRKLLGAFFCTIEGEELQSVSRDCILKILKELNISVSSDALEKILCYTNSTQINAGSFLKNISNYIAMSSFSNCITIEILDSYLKFLGIPEESNETAYSRQIATEVKREVWRRDEGQCVSCRSKELLEFDHIIPFVKGGSNTVRNIQLLCELCNRTKNSKIS